LTTIFVFKNISRIDPGDGVVRVSILGVKTP
jgi:hypothetical protein